MIRNWRTLLLCALLCGGVPTASAQFGGHEGDAVIYMVSAKGSGEFQSVSPLLRNDAASTAKFRYVDRTTLPLVPGTPFPLFRQILYETPDELFQVGTDFEPTVGIHRVFIAPIKVLQLTGYVGLGAGLGTVNNYIKIPKGIDLVGDVSLETISIVTWAPKEFPFMVPTDTRGPLTPPNMTGFEYLVSTPGLISLPFFTPWTPMRVRYNGGGWPAGVFSKVLDVDTEVGNTSQIIRISPGKKTPPFRIPGHTHVYVLQGRVDLAPAGSSAVRLKKDFYAYLPQNFVVQMANPREYDGPGGGN